MPPGAVPPFILQYNASSVPIIQLALGGKTLSEAELYDYGIYRVRQQIAPIQGITLPLPYGGKPRQVMVDLDPQALLAKSISAGDVSIAVGLQNLTLPSGSVKLAPREYRVSLNSSPDAVATLNDLPVKVVNGVTVYLRDVAHVRDGFAVQTNMVRQDGRRSVLLTVIKKGGASTLTIVKQLKELLPTIRAAAPPGLEVKELFDQSLFVRAAITGVLTEGAVAAFLTGVMILLFLGSWRSTLVVITSIPLSILTSLAMAVVFAMLASYALSRTIVPTLVRYLLASEAHGPVDAGAAPSVFRWLHGGFQRRFERLRTAYVGALENALARRRRVFGVFAVLAASGAAPPPSFRPHFFPPAAPGQSRPHDRHPAGHRH